MSAKPGRAPNRPGRERRTGSLRDDQRALTRQRLKEAALEVIASDRLPGGTIDEIAATAGASRATFYLHFKSKADLIRELVETMPDRPSTSGTGSAPARPVTRAVRAWLDEVIALYDAQRLYFLAVEQAVAVEPELTEDYYRQVDHYLDRAAGLSARTSRTSACTCCCCGCSSPLCFLWRVRGMELDEERTMPHLTRIWHDALSARQ